MKQNNSKVNSQPTIRELYPGLNDAQLKEAEDNLERYLQLALRVYERIQLDPDAYARFKALTGSEPDATIKGQRPNPS